jgi:L-alanine-DL-glutamate epimerase-like enolase superfamily enzyme
MLGFSIEAAEASTVAAEYKAKGYSAQKWFFRHGPGDGVPGMERNLAMAHAVRDAVGPHYKLMFDAFMGWDVPYSREMLRLLEPVCPTWVEEPLPPERVGSFIDFKRSTSVPLATGEHTYTRWQIKELLIQGAVDYVQADPDWAGGVSELVKICALSSSFDVPAVPHGHSLMPALHIAASQSPSVVPYVEFLIRHQAYKQHFHRLFLAPVNGEVEMPATPGMGFELDESKIRSRERAKATLL